MAKLSKQVLSILETEVQKAVHNASIIGRTKSNDPSLPSWFREKPLPYYEALVDAAYSTIDTILHNHKMYQGYNDVTFVCITGFEAEVRRYYGTEIHEMYKKTFSQYTREDSRIVMTSVLSQEREQEK